MCCVCGKMFKRKTGMSAHDWLEQIYCSHYCRGKNTRRELARKYCANCSKCYSITSFQSKADFFSQACCSTSCQDKWLEFCYRHHIKDSKLEDPEIIIRTKVANLVKHFLDEVLKFGSHDEEEFGKVFDLCMNLIDAQEERRLAMLKMIREKR